jgi:hypothetical protein
MVLRVSGSHSAPSDSTDSSGRYGTNQTTGAIVRDNVFSGAFAFAIVRTATTIG